MAKGGFVSGNGMLWKLSFFSLTIATIYVSSVLVLHRFQLQYLLPVDIYPDASAPISAGLVLPDEEVETRSLGRRIVERAFNATYADLVEACGNLDAENSLKKCLDQLYEKRKDPISPYASKWPWWFQTMVRDAKQPSTGLFGGWHFLQFPDPLLQMCIYEKGGTKMWRNAHCEVLQATSSNNLTGTSVTTCYQHQGMLAKTNVQRAVFLRDPLERYLSGFLDKCTTYHRVSETHCQPLAIFQSNQTDHVKDYLQDTQKLFEIYVDASPLKWDLHFLPLSLQCGGLYDHIQDYDFVGMMDASFYQELGRFVQHFPNPVLEEKVRKAFGLNGKENETNYGTEQKSALHTSQYYTANTIRRVLQYTSIDYMLLNLSIPQWAEEILQRDETFLV